MNALLCIQILSFTIGYVPFSKGNYIALNSETTALAWEDGSAV